MPIAWYPGSSLGLPETLSDTGAPQPLDLSLHRRGGGGFARRAQFVAALAALPTVPKPVLPLLRELVRERQLVTFHSVFEDYVVMS